MEQSKELLESGSVPATLDEATKADLRRSHFILGNSEPNFQTIHQQEYYDKSKMNPLDNVDFKNVERRLRATSYVLGNDKPDYTSETAARFTKPEISKDMYGPKTISTAQLQQSHYVFGTNNDPWVTTQQASYVPKSIEQKLYSKNLTKTNFILGDDKPTLKSVNQETFVRHPVVAREVDKELAADLRSKKIFIN